MAPQPSAGMGAKFNENNSHLNFLGNSVYLVGSDPFVQAGCTQSIESKILALNDVLLGLSLTLKQTMLIFTRQMLSKEEWKLKANFLSEFLFHLLCFSL